MACVRRVTCRWLQQELRDHAGEFGAVMIYHGVLAVSRDDSARQFAERHLVTEQKHLQLMEQMIPRDHRVRLLPIWPDGWLTGAIPALLGVRRFSTRLRPSKPSLIIITSNRSCA